jgi:hypothetical protein
VGGLILASAAAAIAACGAAQPHPLPAETATATAETTVTATSTVEATATATATTVFIPTLGPLPDNSDLQLPFPGYKQEIFINGWNILKDSWNPLWMKWGRMTADHLGPGGSLVVRPVEGEAGIVCEDAVDGSYKGMALCPPLGLVMAGC